LHVELDIVFSADNDTGHPTEPITLTLMITASATAASLQSAEEAIKAINTIKAWKSAVKIIKLVMDAVTPIAAVCPISFFSPSFAETTSALQLNPYAKLAWSLLSKIPEVRLLVFSKYMECYFFNLTARICYSGSSVMRVSKHYLRRFVMPSNLQRRPTL
jgi:hypothetical protein